MQSGLNSLVGWLLGIHSFQVCIEGEDRVLTNSKIEKKVKTGYCKLYEISNFCLALKD